MLPFFKLIIMNRHIQIVRMDTSILDYFKMEMNLDNESKEYQNIKIDEFKEKLTESLNCSLARKEIAWQDAQID